MSGLTKNAFYNIIFKDTPHIYGAKFTGNRNSNVFFEVYYENDAYAFYLSLRNGKFKYQGELVNVVPFDESRDSERLRKQQIDIFYNLRLKEFDSASGRDSNVSKASGSSSGSPSSGNESSGGKSRRKRKCRKSMKSRRRKSKRRY